jgi:cytochrome o ubiquinol oxidase subunit 2
LSIRNLFTLIVAGAGLTLAGCSGGVLDPKGQVGMDEKNLIILCTILMLIVVVPVIFLTLYFAWKYRASRDFEIYTPKWAHSTKIEAVVWSIPILIVVSLSVITWRSTHALDPYAPLEGQGEHLTVEVVSLNWKWLFIYPEQGIATVNELVFPANKPVAFKITSESTMNSFFIPQLGSQIYSMAGMETKLHLIADEPGTYKGISSNYSGAGFTGMKQSQTSLTSGAYKQLAEPSENNPVTYFSKVDDGLFHNIVMKYMKDHGSMDFYNKPENAVMGEHHAMPEMQHSHHQEDAQ